MSVRRRIAGLEAAASGTRSRRVLVACVGLSVLTFVYAVAELAIGYTYVPGRRGGLLLSGVPTFMIAFASLSFCLVSASVVADHLDPRDNTAAYRRARRWLLKVGIALLVLAPFAEIGMLAVHAMGGPAPPRFSGFAANAALHDPALAHHGERMHDLMRSPVLVWSLAGSALAGLLLIVVGRLGVSVWPQLRALAAIAFCLLCGVFLLLGVLEVFFRGEVSLERYGIISATTYPAAFNAALLARALTGAMMLTIGVAACWVFVRRGAAVFENES